MFPVQRWSGTYRASKSGDRLRRISFAEDGAAECGGVREVGS